MDLRGRWTSQPSPSVLTPEDLAPEFRRGLQAMWVANKTHPQNRGDTRAARSRWGDGYHLNQSSYPNATQAIASIPAPRASSGTALTIFLMASAPPHGQDYRARYACSVIGGTSSFPRLWLPNSTDTIRFTVTDVGGSGASATSSHSYSLAEKNGFAAAGRAGRDKRSVAVFSRGVATYVTHSFDLRNGPSGTLHVGCEDASGSSPWLSGGITAVLLWEVELPDSALLDATVGGWTIFARRRSRVWTGPAAVEGGFNPAWVRRNVLIGAGTVQ